MSENPKQRLKIEFPETFSFLPKKLAKEIELVEHLNSERDKKKSREISSANN